MSRLIVALCVVGCLYAVQAYSYTSLEEMSTAEILNRAYDKLLNVSNIWYFGEDLAKCIAVSQMRTLDDDLDINFVQTIAKFVHKAEKEEIPFEQLVDIARDLHIKDSYHMSETEIEMTRDIFSQFLNSYEQDIEYYYNRWCTFNDDYMPHEFLELNAEIFRKLHTLRSNVSSTNKGGMINAMIKIIKQADQELVKCGKFRDLEKMVKRRSYKTLPTFTHDELVNELYSSYEVLFTCKFLHSFIPADKILTKFLKNINQLMSYI